ncbi:unnamed protein product [Linum tenue]|uniref:Uncharacterized protein n=1 Tax=Linum tenue TaxID=586396 RepID=A0AAV0NMG9_9ROSI|nr:unnamed protein product [Linum tenue]
MEGMVGKPLGSGGRETFGMEGMVGMVGIAPALGSGGNPPPVGRDGMVGMAAPALGSGGNPPPDGRFGMVGMAPALGSGGNPPPVGRDGMVGMAAPAVGSGGNPPVGRVGSGRDGMVGIGGSAVGCGSWRSCRAAIPCSMLQNVTARTRAKRNKLEEEAMILI